MKKEFKSRPWLAGLVVLLLPGVAFAGGGDHHHVLNMMVVVAGLYALAMVGSLVKKVGKPEVLGQLVVGMLVGLLRSVPGPVGEFIEMVLADPIAIFCAEFGVVLLLFKAGLEENIAEMMEVGGRAVLVATVGVVLPVGGGMLGSHFLLPDAGMMVHIFLGATLAATSVGITKAVFDSLGYQSRETRIVLGAAVIDDVMGLIILGVVSAMATGGDVGFGMVMWMLFKAVAFLGGSILVGALVAPTLGRLLSLLHAAPSMKLAILMVFCFGYAYLGQILAGLAPIVGAFAAGLLLDAVHFHRFEESALITKLRKWRGRLPNELDELKTEMDEAIDHEAHTHAEEMVEGIASYFTPVFFVFTGMQVDLTVMANLHVLMVAAVLTVVAYYGKYATALVAGPGVNRKIVGIGMVPRGEVGLIFAAIGKQLGVLDATTFAVAIVVVVATTLIAPMQLGPLIRKEKEDEIP